MPKCPNCGRETYRTEDWACQWCGQPLLSSAFKIVPKTYRQIQDERAPGAKPVLEDEPESAPVSEVEPTAPPQAPEPKPEQMPEPEPEIEPEAPSPPEPVAEIETEAEVKNEAASPPEPEAETAAESEPVPPEPVEVKEKATAEPEEAEPAEANPAAEIQPEVETTATPAPEPVAAPDLEAEATTGVVNATVAELNAAFNADKIGTNARLMDKVLRVSGNVEKVFARNNLDIYYIILAGEGGPSAAAVRCTFNREQSAHLSRLTEGQTTTVQGTYTGYERNIILKECSLVP